jgi:hypothetical protein
VSATSTATQSASTATKVALTATSTPLPASPTSEPALTLLPANPTLPAEPAAPSAQPASSNVLDFWPLLIAAGLVIFGVILLFGRRRAKPAK